VPSCESDVWPGRALRNVMQGPDGTDYPACLQADPPDRLVLESHTLDGEGRSLLEALNSVTFADRDGKTKITVHVREVASVPEAGAMLAGKEAGWTQSQAVPGRRVGRRHQPPDRLHAVRSAHTSTHRLGSWSSVAVARRRRQCRASQPTLSC
jgi:Activator of Hsp90 ATPase homolog 1-like protein